MIFFIVLILLAFTMCCIGIFLVFGSLKGISWLIDPPDRLLSLYPYKHLKSLGTNAIKFYHIYGGIFCILFSSGIVFCIYYYW